MIVHYLIFWHKSVLSITKFTLFLRGLPITCKWEEFPSINKSKEVVQVVVSTWSANNRNQSFGLPRMMKKATFISYIVPCYFFKWPEYFVLANTRKVLHFVLSKKIKMKKQGQNSWYIVVPSLSQYLGTNSFDFSSTSTEE